jgi:hypothetical protein
MKKIGAGIGSLIVLGLLAASAAAQSVGPPIFSVGDTWKRSNGQEITVVKVDETSYSFRGAIADCPACLGQTDKNWLLVGVTDADGKAADVTRLGFIPLGPNWKMYDWPLELKKEWTITPTGSWKGTPVSYTVTLVVKAYEDVKTQGGTFKAYKIEQRWRDQWSSWVSMVWYAPDVKNVVKLTSTNRNSKDWELLSYSVKNQ